LLSSLQREKMKMRKSSGTGKVSTSNWNIYVLWQCIYFIVRWSNCILHVVRNAYYIRVKNNQGNENLSTFFFNENMFRFTDCLLGNLNCRLKYQSPLAKNCSLGAKLSWTEMAFLNALSFFEIFSSNQMN
jgi:hypothetical protein